MGFKFSRFFKKKQKKMYFPIMYEDCDVLFVEGLNCKFKYKNELDIAVEETKQVFKKADIIILDLDKEEWISYYAPSTK